MSFASQCDDDADSSCLRTFVDSGGIEDVSMPCY